MDVERALHDEAYSLAPPPTEVYSAYQSDLQGEGHLLFGAEIGYISGLYADTSSSEVVVTSNSKSLSKSRLFPQYFHGGHLN